MIDREGSAPAGQRLAELVRGELTGEVSASLHRAGRERLLDALAGGPAAEVTTPTSWLPWASGSGAWRYLTPLAAAAAIAFAFGGGYVVGARRTEVLVVAAEQQAARVAAAGVATPLASTAPSVAPAAAPSSPPAAASAAPELLPTLRQLLERGEAAKVIERVERMGVDGCLRSCSASDLEAFADAARYTGRNDLAARVLPAQRQRFPGTDLAATAAFLLGRSAEGGDSDAEAARWYSTYLRERPGGALSGEALGRSMQIAQRGGDGARARSLAEQYLRAAPTGGYAPQARQILSRQ